MDMMKMKDQRKTTRRMTSCGVDGFVGLPFERVAEVESCCSMAERSSAEATVGGCLIGQ